MKINLFKLWCRLSAISVIAILLMIAFFDGPVANFCIRRIHFSSLLHNAPSSLQIAAWLGGSMATIGIYIALTRRFPKWAQALMLSAIAALVSLCLTEWFIKPLFGRPDPITFVYHLRHYFGWHTRHLSFSAFPSTHAALAAAALSIFALYFPRLRLACILTILAVDMMLVLGSWHFMSDALAGNLLGFTIAAIILKADEAWKKPARSEVPVT